MNSLILTLALSLCELYINTSVAAEKKNKQIILYREANQYSHLTLKDICNIIFKKNVRIPLERGFNKSINQILLQDKQNYSNRGINLDFMAFDEDLQFHESSFRKKSKGISPTSDRLYLPSFLSFAQKSPLSLNNRLDGEEIAETLQSEASFTKATDKKPIVATYGCGPCVALGGYDTVNKIAFIVHFTFSSQLKNKIGTVKGSFFSTIHQS